MLDPLIKFKDHYFEHYRFNIVQYDNTCLPPGAVGLVWFILWVFLMYDSPNTHPRISERERLYITSSLKKEVTYKHIFYSLFF